MSATEQPRGTRRRSQFLLRANADSVLVLVFKYLNGELSRAFSPREGKERAADAVLAFWKPYALRAKRADQDEQQDAARNSVAALSRQMRAICEDFGIESALEAQGKPDMEAVLAALVARLEAPSTAFLPQQRSRSTPATVSPSIPISHQASSPASEADRDVIFVDDDDLLGDLN